MPRRTKQQDYELAQEETLPEPETPDEPIEEVPPPVVKPKRKCTEKQLAALAAGRAKNPRFKAKQ